MQSDTRYDTQQETQHDVPPAIQGIVKKRKKKIVAAAALAVFLVLIVWLYVTNTNISVSEFAIGRSDIPKEFDGFKIACISDLHNHNRGEELLSKLKDAKADIIVITGDLVDSSRPDVNAAMDLVQHTVKVAPVYYVNGNHEAWLGSYDALREELLQAGVDVLDDKAVELERKGAKINLCGVQDPDFAERGASESLREAIITSKLEPLLASDCYNVVLSHRPELFEAYTHIGADLVFAGHAHGGQVRLPLIGGLVAPNQGLFPKYTAGLYREGTTDMVVSRGLGNSIIPLRVNNMPELVVVTLECLPE